MRIKLNYLAIIKMAEEINKAVDVLKVTELREELRKRDLSTTGNKAVLVQRLKTSMMEDVEKNGGEENSEGVCWLIMSLLIIMIAVEIIILHYIIRIL